MSERKASGALVHALKEKLDRPELIDRFVSTFQERALALQRENTRETGDAERRVRDCERRVANLTEALAKVGWSEALAARLREEEGQLGRLKGERTAGARGAAPAAIPQPDAIAAYLKNLFALLETNPARGREVLSRFVVPVVMTPEIEGPNRRYRATGAFNLSFPCTPRAAPRVGQESRVARGGFAPANRSARMAAMTHAIELRGP